MFFIDKYRLEKSVTNYFAKREIGVKTTHYKDYTIIGTNLAFPSLYQDKMSFFSVTLFRSGWVYYEFEFGPLNITPEINALLCEFNCQIDWLTAYVNEKDSVLSVKYSDYGVNQSHINKVLTQILNKLCSDRCVEILSQITKYVKRVD